MLPSFSKQAKQQGFTLVELIIIIILLSIVGLGITQIITQQINIYLDANARHQIRSDGQLALDRMGRELREAVPRSIRVSGSGDCIEFLPIITASEYEFLPVPVNTSINAIDFLPAYAPVGSLNSYVIIYPRSVDDIYLSNIAIEQLASVVPDGNPGRGNFEIVTLASSHRFPHSSPMKRIFISSEPVSFCLVGSDLYRFSGYGLQAAQPTTIAAGGTVEILARNIVNAGSSFTYTAGSLNRSALVQFNLVIQGRTNETLILDHEVNIRNVP